jgi:hypothetical protein
MRTSCFPEPSRAGFGFTEPPNKAPAAAGRLQCERPGGPSASPRWTIEFVCVDAVPAADAERLGCLLSHEDE